MKTIHFLSVCVIAIILFSCTKQGATGPQGPAGVANVTVTSITVNPTDWNLYNSTHWHYTCGVSPSTSDVVNVYFSHDGSTFTGIPFVGVFSTDDELYFNMETGYDLVLGYYNPNGDSPNDYADATLYFNASIIPPAIQYKYPNTDWQNASEVQNIPEVRAALNNANNK